MQNSPSLRLAILKRVFVLFYLAAILLSSNTSLVSEVNYRITYPPITAIDEGAGIHDYFMNEQGHILWTEFIVTDATFGKGIMTANILRPVDGEYHIQNVERYQAPVSGNARPYRIFDYNNQDQFMMLEITNGTQFAYVFNGGSYVNLLHPRKILDGPVEGIESWGSASLGSIADNGSIFGFIDTFPTAEIYQWDTSGNFSKIYEEPPGLVLRSLPNKRGTVLYSTDEDQPSFFYGRTGGAESIPALQSSGVLNDKDQILGTNFIYLPAEDYGLPEGLTTFEGNSTFVPIASDFLYRSSFTSEFEVYEDGAFQKMNLIDPDKPGFVPNIASRIYGVNKEGDILVGDVRPVDGVNVETIMLLQRADNIRATITVEPKQVAVGENFYLNVAIKNTSEEPFALAGVFGESFQALGTATAGLEQLENPPGAAIGPEQTFVQRFPWKGNAPGKLKFKFKVVGFTADDTQFLTEELISDEVQIGGDPIKIEYETLPLVPRKPPEDLEEISIVNMNVQEHPDNVGDENDKWIVTDKIPGAEFDSVISPKIKLKITNVWEKKTPVTASIQGLDARARDKTPLGARVKTIGTFPIDLGTIAFGETVEREIVLDIRDDGRFDFKALATSIPDGTTDQYNTFETVSPIAVGDPFPVEIELKFDRKPNITKNSDGTFFINPGSSLKILASVTNNTSNSTLNFYGIETKPPTLEQPKGNAFGGTLTSEIANGKEPPFPHDHEIPAASTAVLSTTIRTDPIGAPSGLVSWVLPEGDEVILVDDQTKEETEVSADEILITGTLGSYEGDDLAIKIVQDYSLPPVPVLSLGESAGNISYNALIGMEEWVYDSFVGMGGLADYIVSDPTAIFRALGAGGQSIFNAAEMAAITWQNMTEEERLEFVKGIAEQVPERAALFYFTRQPFKPEELEAAKQAAQEATYVFFTDVENAYASNDPLQITAVWGNISGKAALELATAGLPTPKFTKFTRGVEALRLATNNKAAQLITKTEAYLRTVKGPISFFHARTYWGIGGKELQGVQEVLGALGMKGYARERNPRSIALIEQLKEAIWKPQAMKPKGISEIDRLLIGEERLAKINQRLKSVRNPSESLDTDGITAIFKPDSEAKVLKRLEGQPQEVKDAVLERRKLRIKEYGENRANFEKWSKPVEDGGGIPVDFDYNSNVSTRPSGILKDKNRTFEYVDVGDPGNPILVPKMADEAGILKYISGDVDWIHFSWLDGTPLSPEVASALYRILSRCCGLQHGETISWFNKGQTLFKGKINQLDEYLRGAKALLEVTGDSLRAVHINPKNTFFAPDGRSHLIFFDEGTKVLRQLRDEAKVSTFLANLADVSRFRYALLPGNWFENANPEDNSIGGKDWSFNNNPDALVLRKSVDGGVEQFDGTSWQPTDVNTIAGKVSMAPMTTTTVDANAGDTVLEISDLSLLSEADLKNRVDGWFELGQTIVIAPGEQTQEIHVIKDFGSIILENPLQYDHPAGTAIAVIPPNMEVDESANEDYLRILSSDSSEDGSQLTVTWSSVSGVNYILESTTSLHTEDWTMMSENISSNSSTTRLSFPLPTDETRIFYRLRRVGP